MRVWIVEDNVADVYLLREALRCGGLDFADEVALNGDQLVALLEAMKENRIQPPEAVILDLHLIKFKGTEIMELIRSAPGLANVPIVVLTSSQDPADPDRAFHSGATAYFHKSVDLDDCMRTGREIVYLLQRPAEARAASPTS